MTYRQHDRFTFEDTSVDANVPDNDTARLMYYLNCVCSAIQYNDNDISRYRDYRNWSRLSKEEIRTLVALCYTLSPDVFDNRVFFQSDALCGDSPNRFFEINQVRDQLVAVETIVVAGRTRRVNSIMTYKMSWMRRNYLNPIQNLARRLSDERSSSACVIL